MWRRVVWQTFTNISGEFSVLKMESAQFFETQVPIYQTVQYHIPENHCLQFYTIITHNCLAPPPPQSLLSCREAVLSFCLALTLSNFTAFWCTIYESVIECRIITTFFGKVLMWCVLKNPQYATSHRYSAFFFLTERQTPLSHLLGDI
jgi:hypothetical protein